MRYKDTLGDWYLKEAQLHIDVVDEGTPDEQFLIALHELIEWKLCATRGISQSDVDAFDFGFKGDGEPGDDPSSPYRKEHREASIVEHLVAHFMGMTSYGKVE